MAIEDLVDEAVGPAPLVEEVGVDELPAFGLGLGFGLEFGFEVKSEWECESEGLDAMLFGFI